MKGGGRSVLVWPNRPSCWQQTGNRWHGAIYTYLPQSNGSSSLPETRAPQHDRDVIGGRSGERRGNRVEEFQPVRAAIIYRGNRYL